MVAVPIHAIRSKGAALALLSLLLSGCGGQAARLAAPPTSAALVPIRGHQADLVAWVNVTPTTLHAGETAQIEVGVRNPTNHPVTIGFTSGSCRLSYVVEDAGGTPVAPGMVCTCDAPTYAMAPGEVLMARHTWDGTDGSGGTLTPGEYRVKNSGFLFPAVRPVAVQLLAP